VLALCCERLADDWQQSYGHPVLVAESFVDSQLFRGTCYKAQGWSLLGETQGSGRSRQDYYTEHGRPKQLWMRELQPKARAVLCAKRLPAELQHVEDAVIPRCEATGPQLRKLLVLCRQVPDWRAKKGKDYPLHCLLAIMVMATLAGIVRGQRDLAAFASKLTPFQLRTLGSYRNRSGGYDYPKETTFQRVLAKLDAAAFERILIEWEIQRTGADGGDDQVGIDGKAQRGSTPHVRDEQKAQLVSAQSLPSGRVLGTVAVEEKSNEIPAARELLGRLGPLDGKLVMLDALHSCQQTLRQIHQDNGADYLMPVKGKDKGKRTKESVVYVSTLDPDPARGQELLGRVRQYWGIEGGLHQRLDVSCGEDSSRVRNRNALLVLGIIRRATLGIYLHWRKRRKNQRQSTVKDFHDAMNRFNNRLAFSTISAK
jgi:predicted transposase YbfD/YdcC